MDRLHAHIKAGGSQVLDLRRDALIAVGGSALPSLLGEGVWQEG